MKGEKQLRRERRDQRAARDCVLAITANEDAGSHDTGRVEEPT